MPHEGSLAPVPTGRIEDDAVLPEDDEDPWLDEDEIEGEAQPPPRRPFWNR